MSSIKLACVVPNLAKVSDIDFIVNVANKVNSNFGAPHLIEIKFVGIQVFMRAFYDGLNRVYSIFSSKVIIFPKKRKHYLEIQRPLIFGASDMSSNF